MLFIIFEKGNNQRNCPKYFEIPKHAFLIFENENKYKTVLRFASFFFLLIQKWSEQKKCGRYFQIHKYGFLIFEEGNKQKNLGKISKNSFFSI